jgi:hypothetical protein
MTNALLRLLALVLLAAAASAEIPLERVQWQPEFGQPGAGMLAGRAEFVMLFVQADPSVTSAKDKFSWYLHHDYTGDANIGAMSIGVEPNFGVRSETDVERFARGADDGSLLRAFAGSKPGVMLVFDPSGRLIDMKAPSEVDDVWLHTLRKIAEKATPLLDEGSIPGALRPALPWYLVGDMKKFAAAAGKIQGGEAALRAMAGKAAELAQAREAIATDASAKPSDRLLALLQLQAIAVDFPNTAALAQKATKSLKDDAAIKAEQAGWAAFVAYVGQMKGVKGKGADAAQQPLLAAVAAKHPDTYAAELATRISAYSGIPITPPAK